MKTGGNLALLLILIFAGSIIKLPAQKNNFKQDIQSAFQLFSSPSILEGLKLEEQRRMIGNRSHWNFLKLVGEIGGHELRRLLLDAKPNLKSALVKKDNGQNRFRKTGQGSEPSGGGKSEKWPFTNNIPYGLILALWLANYLTSR